MKWLFGGAQNLERGFGGPNLSMKCDLFFTNETEWVK